MKNKDNQQLIFKSSRILMLSKNISCMLRNRFEVLQDYEEDEEAL